MAKRGGPVEPTLNDLDGSSGESPATLPAGPPMSKLAPGTTVGRYVIEGPLGEGGMGVVYVARDPQLDRRVALKLLRPGSVEGELGSEGRNRFVREAHAMAKLNHPNVVAIYDCEVYGDQVFLAVELVVGPTVLGWLREAPRDWREILEVFLKAGRGLAAAHAAGLVHRDFKPANVLIGKGGEVKVTDFGIARAATVEPGNTTQELVAAAAELSANPLLATPLTRDGTVSGTPGYMAPEQMLGRGGDARTDEFSFCVALYRSLYGEWPFEGKLNPRRGKYRLKPAPKGTHVPKWVRRELLRGLSIKPEDRYPALTDLLDALADHPEVRLRRALALAGVAVLVLAAAAGSAFMVLRQRAAADPCHDPEGKLAGVWDDDARLRIRAAFDATTGPDAASTAAYAERAMDGASAAWLAAYRDACEATRGRHVQPEAALQLRLDCLDDQRFDLGAAAELLSHPEAGDPASVIGAATTLPLPSECADARALSVIEQPSPERRPQLEALRLKLARGRALLGAGKDLEAVKALEPLPDQAAALDAPALQANALKALADVYRRLDDYKRSSELNVRTESVAAAAHLEQLATRAAAAVAEDKTLLGSSPGEVDAWLERARGDLRRAGSGGAAEYYLELALEDAETFRGHDAAAVAHARRTLELAEKLFGSDRAETMWAANDLATDVEPLGSYEESISLLRKAVAGSDAILGPKSQQALTPQYNLARFLYNLGRTTEAEQALDGLFGRLGSQVRIQTAAGKALQAALLAERGRRAESLQAAGQAIEQAAGLHMLSNPNWSVVPQYAVEAYLRDGQPKVALEEYEKYLAHQEIAADSPGWVAFLRLGGWAYLDVGEPERAQPILERALKLSAAHAFYPGWVARLRYQLAKALSETGGDPARAEALAQTAHDELAQWATARPTGSGDDLGAAQRRLLAEVDAWRASAFAPPGVPANRQRAARAP